MTTEPRTRRQLREALAAEKRLNARYEKELRARYDYLVSSGWEPDSYYSSISGQVTLWFPPKHKSEDELEADARTATLKTVIEALELTDYGYRKPGAYFYSGILKAGPEDKRTDEERLWDDLQTAIGVRAKRKEQEDYAAAEKRVAGLTKRNELVVGGAISPNAIRAGDSFYEALANGAGRIPASHITAKRISAEDLNRPIKPAPPIVNTRLGQVAISHDGLTQYGYFHVPRISHFSVWASDSETGASWKVGEIEKGETLTISNQEYNKPRWYFVKAEDASGNVSEPSDRISATVKPLVDREMLAEIIDNVQIKLDVKGLQAAVDAINNIEITTADKARENAGVTPKKKPAPKKKESK